MLHYNRNGFSIQETDEGLNIALQNAWSDLPHDLHVGLIANSTITGIFNHDGCLYMTLQKHENDMKYILMKISIHKNGTLRFDSMGLMESTYNNIIDALNNCVPREE